MSYLVIFIIAVMFIVIFYIYTVQLSYKQFISFAGNPPGTNCAAMNSAYGEERMKYMAMTEWGYLAVYANGFFNLNDKITNQGALACFCENRWKLGYSRDDYYNVVWYDYVTPSYQICKVQMEFTHPFGYAALFSYLITLIVVIQSSLIRKVFVALSGIISFESNSRRMHFILVSVFLMYFIYYGILNLLAPMRIRVFGIEAVLLNIYWDFNITWYENVGSEIALSLIIKAFGAPVEYYLKALVKLFK